MPTLTLPGPLHLAQINTQNAPSTQVSPLPGAGGIGHYLLEQPLPLVGLLVVAAAIAFFLLNRAARGRQAVAAAGLLIALAAGVYALATLVTTTGERLLTRTHELIEATARADTAALDRLLTDDAILRTPYGGPFTRPRLMDLVDRYPGGAWPVSSPRVSERQAAVDSPTLARTQARVKVDVQPMNGMTVGSWWRIQWRRAPDGSWRASEIECVHIDFVPAGYRLGG